MRPRILFILAATFSAILALSSVVTIRHGRAQDVGPSLFSDEPGAKPVDATRQPFSVAQNTEPPPLPQADDAVAPAGAEALTQGPVHEAFAKPMELNAAPVPLIKKRPPDPIPEIPPAQQPDGKDIVWIPGYWAWDDGREDFLWVSGVYRAAPPYQTWVPGYWDEVEGGFQWTPGFWASTAKADVDYLPQPPESQEHGPTAPQPSDNHFWVPGNWVYQNVNVVQPYAWQPGYWAVCQPDWIFVPAHYVWTPGGYVFVSGYWDYTLSRRGCLFAPLYFNQPVYLQAGYAYTPSILINVGGFNDCLFCRPAYCSYYFGDYFGPRYVGLGFRPWCSVGIGVGFGFDPLFTYYRWNNSRRNPNWLANTRQHFELASRNDALRPPRTFLAQQQLLKANGGKPGNNNFLMASTLKQAAADPAQAGLSNNVKFHTISQSDRMALADKGKELQQVSTQRLDLEKKNVNVGGGKLGGGKFDKGSDGAVAGSPKFNGTGPALGGANNGTSGDDDGKNNSKLGKLKLPTAAASNLKVATGGSGNAAGSQGTQGDAAGSQGGVGSGRQGKYFGSQGLGSSAGSGAAGSGAAGSGAAGSGAVGSGRAGSGAMSGNTGSSGRSGRSTLGSGIGGNTINPGNKNNSVGSGAAGSGTTMGGSKQTLGGSGGAGGAAGGIGSGAAGGTSSGGSQPRIFTNPSGGSTGSSGPIGNPSGAGRGASGFGAGGFGAGGAGAGGAGAGGAGSGSGRGSGSGGNQQQQQKDKDDSKKKSDITPPRSNLALTPPNAGPMDAAGVLKADRQARNFSADSGMNDISRQMKSAQTIDLGVNDKDGAAGTSGSGSNTRSSRGLAGLGSSGSSDGGNRNLPTANPNSGNPQASDLRTFNQSQTPKSPYLPRYDYQTLMDRGRALSGGVAGSGVGTAPEGDNSITTTRPKDPMINYGAPSGQARSSSYRSAGLPGPTGPSMFGPTGQSMSGIAAPGVSGINSQMTSGISGQMLSGISAPMQSGISGTMSSGISAPMASGISGPLTSGISGLTNASGPRASGSYMAPGGFQGGTAGSLTGGQPMLDPSGRSYNPGVGSPGSYIPAR